MTKQQLKEWVNELSNLSVSPHAKMEIISKIDQLSEPEPEKIPFQFPVPDGYEAYTREGRKVTQLVKFEGIDSLENIRGVINQGLYSWYSDGRYRKGQDHYLDLLLRKISPEMVTVWLNYYGDNLGGVYYTEDAADALCKPNRIGPAIRLQFEKPKNS